MVASKNYLIASAILFSLAFALLSQALDGRRFVYCVSCDEYGHNDYVDNSNGTIIANETKR